MDRLLAGYRRFRAEGWPQQRTVFESLARNGQSPTALVVACVDSRVEPAMAYHGTSAALEFGVRVLEVRDLIVLGHGSCSGVQALLEGAPANARDFIAPWMSMAEPARVRALDCASAEARQQCCEHEVIKVSLANLMSFPWIAERVAAGTLTLHGAWFAIHTGVLAILQPDGSFAPA
jgi:carbonic anhydrase